MLRLLQIHRGQSWLWQSVNTLGACCPCAFDRNCCCRRANGTDTAPSNAASGNGNEERGGGHILFDTSSAVGSGRWPCVDVAASKPKIHAGGRTRSRSPAQPVSPLGASTRAKSPRGRGRNGISSPISDDGLSIMSGSTWGGGRSIASPGRCEGDLRHR